MASTTSVAASAQRREGRVDRRRARTTAAILEAAEREFVTHTYHAARIEDIAERADVSVGSIYTHFGGKFALYLAIIDRALSVQEGYLADAIDGDLTAGEQLRALGEAYVRFYLDHPGHFRLLMLPPPRVRNRDAADAVQHLADRGERLIEAMSRVITAGVTDGSIAPVDPGRAAHFLWGAWSGVMTLHLRPDRLALSDKELRAVLAEGQRIVTEGMTAQR